MTITLLGSCSKTTPKKEPIPIFIRIEPSSSTPIYRQIVDQIKYQIATGILQPADKIPSVRQLATQLAVNQNTILKVYNQLSNENILTIERGSGTFVSTTKQPISAAQRRTTVANILREAAVQAVHLDLDINQTKSLLEKEYLAIRSQEQKNRSKTK